MSLSSLDMRHTALVLIDVQRGVVNLPTLPRSIRQILPRIGQVRATQEVLAACTAVAG
jgi:nicotinamidase-related amidase